MLWWSVLLGGGFGQFLSFKIEIWRTDGVPCCFAEIDLVVGSWYF